MMSKYDMHGSNTRYFNTDIQVLRALAVIMVMIEHVQINLFYWRSSLQVFIGLYWRGAPGVDLFFVISGFVIARGLLPRLHAQTDKMAFLAETLTFLLRRFWRLQPGAWLWLAIPLVLTVTFNASNAFHGLDGNLPSALTALLAINNLRSALLPPNSSPPQLFFPYWSLSLEEQFYLLLPVLIFLCRTRLTAIFMLVALYQFVSSWALPYTYTRPGALAAGVLLAIWSAHPAYKVMEPKFLARGAVSRAVFLIVMLTLLGVALSLLIAPMMTVRYGVVEIIAGLLVYAASFDRDYIMAPGRLKRAMEWIGARSYSLYLTHIPAYALARELIYRVHRPTWEHDWGEAAAHFALGLAIAVLLAQLTYRFIETPCRVYGRTLRVRVPGAVPATTGDMESATG